jgi:hypothetical protein
VRQVAKVVGNLYWASRAVECGRYFIHRIIQLTVGFGYEKSNQNRKVKIGAEAQMDLAWWRWALGADRLGAGVPLSAPIALHMETRISSEVSVAWLTNAGAHEGGERQPSFGC